MNLFKDAVEELEAFTSSGITSPFEILHRQGVSIGIASGRELHNRILEA